METSDKPQSAQVACMDLCMPGPFSRTALTVGQDAIDALFSARIAVFGLGGVGGYATEALARSGVGTLDLVDHDTVCVTNINRQIIANFDTIGQPKVDVFAKRIARINPACRVTVHQCFYLPEAADRFDFSAFDYVVDCVDTVSAKLSIITEAKRAGVPVISAMGAANKLDPSRLQVADISKTSVCPLAKTIRKELRRRGIKGVKTVFSTEPVTPPQNDFDVDVAACPYRDLCPREALERCQGKRKPQAPPTPGSNAFVPPAAGLLIASEVVKDLACARRAQ